MTVLIDTSFLLALAISSDSHHTAAQQVSADLEGIIVLPIPVMPELFHILSSHGHYQAAVKIYRALQTSGFQVEPITPADRIRMGEIMTQYPDAEFDFADVAIMAIAERLNIKQVCTFDQRNFMIFRPKHCLKLELLP